MRDDLKQFKYSEEELIEIGKATSQKKPWYEKNIDEIKKRIKEFHLRINHNLCCYCQRSLRDEFRMVIDVEHILPSSKYKSYTFEIWNTSASCKRCNMRIKKEDTDFIVKSKADHQKSDFYKFAHPNFDEPFKNLIKYSCQFGPNQFVN